MNIITLLYRITGKKRIKYYNDLIKNQWLSEDELQNIQDKKLQMIVKHAIEYIPFYKKYFKNNYDNIIIKRTKLIDEMPVVNKSLIQNELINFVMQDRKNILNGHTGGSTGKPLKYFYDNNYLEKTYAGMMRSFSWGGWSLGEPMAMIWGGLQEFEKKNNIKSLIKRKITGRHWIKSYNVSEERIKYILEYLNRYNIKYIYGYASIINAMATYKENNHIKIPNIKAIFTTAEMLTNKYRQNIENIFQCKVFDQYGSREITNIASECEYGNMHIFNDMVYTEYKREEKTSDLHKIIVTGLNNYIMPLIRYDIEDYVTPKSSECTCGRKLPILDIKIGRKNDFIKKPNGEKIYPSYFIHLLDDIKLRRFQFIQYNINKLKLLIATGDNKNDLIDKLKKVEKRLQNDLKWEVTLDVEIVEDFNTPYSGKHRYVICKI